MKKRICLGMVMFALSLASAFSVSVTSGAMQLYGYVESKVSVTVVGEGVTSEGKNQTDIDSYSDDLYTSDGRGGVKVGTASIESNTDITISFETGDPIVFNGKEIPLNVDYVFRAEGDNGTYWCYSSYNSSAKRWETYFSKYASGTKSSLSCLSSLDSNLVGKTLSGELLVNIPETCKADFQRYVAQLKQDEQKVLKIRVESVE